jgi:hypothetical protein
MIEPKGSGQSNRVPSPDQLLLPHGDYPLDVAMAAGTDGFHQGVTIAIRIAARSSFVTIHRKRAA